MRMSPLKAALAASVVCLTPALSANSTSKDEKVRHALNRLAFGPRPGDAQHVQALGIKKWIDLQLHPERIPENPVLAAKLRPLDTLSMSTATMLQNYPSPRLVKEMVAGKLPFPDDPDKRMMVDRLAAGMQGKRTRIAPSRRRAIWPRFSRRSSSG